MRNHRLWRVTKRAALEATKDFFEPLMSLRRRSMFWIRELRGKVLRRFK